MADSEIKLVYFINQAGRAEATRLLLAAAGKKYEEVNVNLEQWLQMKPTAPCGTLPIIEIDGKRFGQSRAIASYLAREFGMFGKQNLDGLKIDQTAQVAEDFVLEFANKYYFAKDAEQKAKGAETLKKETAPKYLGFFEKYIQEEGTGFIAGSELTLGDIVVFDVCTGFLKPFVDDCLDNFPLVQALIKTVESNDNIKQYLAKKKSP
ncbi:glutathione S-transferase [Elysia marginata]|uniref:Glutathione S-transferase n=1 Tax=Elysia marginata TaxID=1093978 RepID=A0AAV4JQX0_9GAST|nr:glutathione S-transferase [Elysia marginata]